jgi:hypothetical protein
VLVRGAEEFDMTGCGRWSPSKTPPALQFAIRLDRVADATTHRSAPI